MRILAYILFVIGLITQFIAATAFLEAVQKKSINELGAIVILLIPIVFHVSSITAKYLSVREQKEKVAEKKPDPVPQTA